MTQRPDARAAADGPEHGAGHGPSARAATRARLPARSRARSRARYLARMASPSPYRSLPAARRAALVQHAISSGGRPARALWGARLAARGGGFRAATVQGWPADRLAREVVRLSAETPQDELDLLHLLYVELEPAVQITFLDAAGVAHANGVMAEELVPPYADADAVRRAAAAVRAQHGDEGERYLRTLARYSRDGWPGIEGAAADATAAPNSAASAPADAGRPAAS